MKLREKVAQFSHFVFFFQTLNICLPTAGITPTADYLPPVSSYGKRKPVALAHLYCPAWVSVANLQVMGKETKQIQADDSSTEGELSRLQAVEQGCGLFFFCFHFKSVTYFCYREEKSRNYTNTPSSRISCPVSAALALQEGSINCHTWEP